MRIVEQTPTILRLQIEEPISRFFLLQVSIPFLAFGALSSCVGLSLMIETGKLTTLECDRLEPTQVACELTSYGLFEKRVTQVPNGQLQSAEVEAKEDSDGDRYRIVLITKETRLPLTQYFNNGDQGKRKKARQINAFIRNPEQMSITVRQEDRWMAFLKGGWAILIGGSIIFFGLIHETQTEFVFDKSTKRLHSYRLSAINARTKEYLFKEIKNAEVIEMINDDGDKYYRSQLTLASGKTIPLLISGSKLEKDKTTRSINQFLGIASAE